MHLSDPSLEIYNYKSEIHKIKLKHNNLTKSNHKQALQSKQVNTKLQVKSKQIIIQINISKTTT